MTGKDEIGKVAEAGHADEDEVINQIKIWNLKKKLLIIYLLFIPLRCILANKYDVCSMSCGKMENTGGKLENNRVILPEPLTIPGLNPHSAWTLE